MQNPIQFTPNHIYIILAAILIGFLVYRIFKIRRDNNLEEAFESSINKLMRNKKNKTNTQSKNIYTEKTKKSKLTFDDLIKESETMNVEKYTITNIKKNFFDYINSFKKVKFTNVTGTADETYEQLGMFKDKFFEIFT
jgi:uncharacterized membrane protein YraQ (UPF0718 family)